MEQRENREGNVPAYQTASSSISSHTHTHTNQAVRTCPTFPQSCNKPGASARSLQPVSHYTPNLCRAAAAINPNQPHGSNFCYCCRSFQTVRKARLASGSIRRPSEPGLNRSQPCELSIVSVGSNCILGRYHAGPTAGTSTVTTEWYTNCPRWFL